MIGHTVSHYHILDNIGQGGMGEVFLANDTRLPRKVALKFIHGKLEDDPAARNRFLREAQSAAGIDHPFICKVYEVGEFEKKIFIAMEYLEGQNLSEKLLHGPLAFNEALRIGIEIAEALEAIHQCGLVHRDLKPGNIMLVRHDHAKVMDFGLARPYITREMLEMDTTPPTPQYEVAGTLAYIAPEQLCGETLDRRSDIYSFGLILYEIITGVHPFRQEDGNKTLNLILNSSPPPLARFRAETPALLEHTLQKMLSKDLKMRYQSVHEVWTNLIQLREHLGKPTATSRSQPTIAVLPFIDMSPGKDQAYFCEGMAEELINALAKLGNISVAARTSAFRYRNMDLDIREIGRQLNVETILEGSLRKSGDNLRIGIALTNVDDGYEIWSQRFDRRLDDVFTIQDEISRAVVEKLKVSPFPPSPASGLVYALYLKGRFYWNERTESGLLKSIECYQQAIKKDADYALAYAGLAASYVTLGVYGVMPPLDVMPMAKASAEKALIQNPRLALARASLGCVRSMYEWNWAAADSDFRNAIENEPKNENVHHWYAIHYLTPLGRFAEARSETAIALQMDPLNLAVRASLGLLYYFEHLYDEAIEEHLKTLEMDQNFGMTYLFLGQAYAQKGMFAEAIAALERADALNGKNPETKAVLATVHASYGREAEARTLLRELKFLAEKRYVSPVLLAQIAIGLGETDASFQYLEQAFEKRATDLIWIRVRPAFDRIREDARFTRLCQRVGFP